MHEEPGHEQPDAIPNERRKVFFGLFVFPMLIAITMAILLTGIVLLTHEDETPESLVTAIKTAAPSKRWQKAFELSNELNRSGGMIRSAGIMNEAIHILHDKDHYDARTRAYMAMALGRFRQPEAQAALKQALDSMDEREEPMTAIFVMWALGGLEYSDAAGSVGRFLNSEDPDLRKAAAYVLGTLGNPEARAGLKQSLLDPVADVQWNAALSLARLGDDSGQPILVQMLDRDRLRDVHQMGESEMERTMVNAAKGLALLRAQDAIQVLEDVAGQDLNLKVRQAALAALRSVHSKAVPARA